MQRDLVERAMARDGDAFDELARISIGRLYAVARLILRDDAKAEDATQEALVAAWRHIGALRDPDRFDAWLHRLLVRSCYREAGRTKRLGNIEIHARVLEASEPDASLGLADRDQLERGFRRLDTDQRAVLVLHYYLGLRLDEAAEVLGIPPGTVRSRLHRAIVAMRAALEADARTRMLTEGRPT
jgi:RNA polymerase sigma-70 factor, ECF subfamily